MAEGGQAEAAAPLDGEGVIAGSDSGGDVGASDAVVGGSNSAVPAPVREQTLLTAFFRGNLPSDEPYFKFAFERDAAQRAKEQAEREAREAAEAAEIARVLAVRREARRRASTSRKALEARRLEAEARLRYEGREVIPGLYLGSRMAAQNREWLEEAAIRSVLNCTPDVSCYFEDEWFGEEQQDRDIAAAVDDGSRSNVSQGDDYSGGSQYRLEYLRIQVADDRSEDIAQHFRSACEFIHGALTRAENVLVHCREGRSRSVSCVLAYLMHHRRVPLTEAYDMVLNAGLTVVTHTVNLDKGTSHASVESGPRALAVARSRGQDTAGDADRIDGGTAETEPETGAADQPAASGEYHPMLADQLQESETTTTAANDKGDNIKTATLVFRAPIGVNDGFQKQLMNFEEEVFGERGADFFDKSGRRGRQAARNETFTYSDDQNLKLSSLEVADEASLHNGDSMDRLLVEAAETELHRKHEEERARKSAEEAAEAEAEAEVKRKAETNVVDLSGPASATQAPGTASTNAKPDPPRKRPPPPATKPIELKRRKPAQKKLPPQSTTLLQFFAKR